MEEAPNQENYGEATEKLKSSIEEIDSRISEKEQAQKRLLEETLDNYDSAPVGAHFLGNLADDLKAIEADIGKLRDEKTSILKDFVDKWEK